MGEPHFSCCLRGLHDLPVLLHVLTFCLVSRVSICGFSSDLHSPTWALLQVAYHQGCVVTGDGAGQFWAITEQT